MVSSAGYFTSNMLQFSPLSRSSCFPKQGFNLIETTGVETATVKTLCSRSSMCMDQIKGHSCALQYNSERENLGMAAWCTAGAVD